jgi:hypothetical protein
MNFHRPRPIALESLLMVSKNIPMKDAQKITSSYKRTVTSSSKLRRLQTLRSRRKFMLENQIDINHEKYLEFDPQYVQYEYYTLDCTVLYENLFDLRASYLSFMAVLVIMEKIIRRVRPEFSLHAKSSKMRRATYIPCCIHRLGIPSYQATDSAAQSFLYVRVPSCRQKHYSSCWMYQSRTPYILIAFFTKLG